MRSTENIQAKLKILQPYEEAVECNNCLKPIGQIPFAVPLAKFVRTRRINNSKKFFFHASSEQFAWCRKKYLCVYHILETILNGFINDCYVACRYVQFIRENFQNIRIFCQINTDNRVEKNNHLFLMNNANINIT